MTRVSKNSKNAQTDVDIEQKNNALLMSQDDDIGDSDVELAIDVFQTPNEIVIQSPIAGVKEEDLEVSVEGDMVTIRGKREREQEVAEKDYYYQECYWGSFSRTISLPANDVDPDRAEASIKNGILTIRIPRIEKRRARKLSVSRQDDQT